MLYIRLLRYFTKVDDIIIFGQSLRGLRQGESMHLPRQGLLRNFAWPRGLSAVILSALFLAVVLRAFLSPVVLSLCLEDGFHVFADGPTRSLTDICGRCSPHSIVMMPDRVLGRKSWTQLAFKSPVSYEIEYDLGLSLPLRG